MAITMEAGVREVAEGRGPPVLLGDNVFNLKRAGMMSLGELAVLAGVARAASDCLDQGFVHEAFRHLDRSFRNFRAFD
jgi:hypothetical protein